jgi:SAM-dependent methyltransferase
MGFHFDRDVQTSYDNVAREYADKLYGELAGKPFDRERLGLFARRVKDGRVCDLGCGPAQIARYLRDRGVDAFGVDLSAGMLAQARRLNPDLQLVQSSMLALGLRSEVLDGIAAFYCILHIPRVHVSSALGEMHRVLKPGGLLLITFHIGTNSTHLDELFGKPVNMDAAFFTTAEVCDCLQAAGFRVEEALERDPYDPEIEYQSRRSYILAVRPGA